MRLALAQRTQHQGQCSTFHDAFEAGRPRGAGAAAAGAEVGEAERRRPAAIVLELASATPKRPAFKAASSAKHLQVTGGQPAVLAGSRSLPKCVTDDTQPVYWRLSSQGQRQSNLSEERMLRHSSSMNTRNRHVYYAAGLRVKNMGKTLPLRQQSTHPRVMSTRGGSGPAAAATSAAQAISKLCCACPPVACANSDRSSTMRPSGSLRLGPAPPTSLSARMHHLGP